VLQEVTPAAFAWFGQGAVPESAHERSDITMRMDRRKTVGDGFFPRVSDEAVSRGVFFLYGPEGHGVSPIKSQEQAVEIFDGL
jgi:hypothetical protein